MTLEWALGPCLYGFSLPFYLQMPIQRPSFHRNVIYINVILVSHLLQGSLLVVDFHGTKILCFGKVI